MFRKFADNEKGQGLVEYALLISLVALIAIAGLTLFGFKTADYYNKIVTETAVPFGR